MMAASAALYGFADANEQAAADAANAQFGIWISMAVQLAVGVADWVRNNGKPGTTAVVKTDVKTETSTPTTPET